MIAGILQGTPLPLAMVNIYTTDISNAPECWHLAMYAGDSAILTASRHLENITDKLLTYTSSLARWVKT